ncbi:hypothetical protein [Anaeroselena agilis]|uniref:Uncharacterized protein n=1 Tax=Anaeroselena agilis TaxID=3063788 RepID=A0ABU3P382_9FIRM|nr:hypothetical protein [Selenomonadales bacterium 4137-cl]
MPTSAVTPFTLLLLDAAGHSLLLADGPSGEVLAEFPLPRGYAAIDLLPGPGRNHAFVTLAGHNGTGALCKIDLTARAADHSAMPFPLPHPVQFSLAGDGLVAYLADPAGIPHALDLATAACSTWEKPPDASACAGLAVAGNEIHGVWEADGGGLAAVYSPDGTLLRTCRLGVVPTSLSVVPGLLLATYTASPVSGEGLILFPPDGASPVVVTIQCSRCAASHPVYPAHAASADGLTAYIACEDSASVAVVDLAAATVTGTIHLGRSASRLSLTADGRFAIATSNANADLCLIDLVNRRPLAFTACRRELLRPLAIID